MSGIVEDEIRIRLLHRKTGTHEIVLRELSEFDDNPVNQYALDCFTYEVFRFLLNPARQEEYNFPAHAINLTEIYGAENLEILTSQMITVDADNVIDQNGNEYESEQKSLEYAPALWVATPSCNYSSKKRNRNFSCHCPYDSGKLCRDNFLGTELFSKCFVSLCSKIFRRTNYTNGL